jgi:hypothetical protein
VWPWCEIERRRARAFTRAMNIHRGINCRPADCDGQRAQRTLPQPTAAADAVFAQAGRSCSWVHIQLCWCAFSSLHYHESPLWLLVVGCSIVPPWQNCQLRVERLLWHFPVCLSIRKSGKKLEFLWLLKRIEITHCWWHFIMFASFIRNGCFWFRIACE